MKRQPTHPGTILAEDILPKLDISITALAEEVLGVSRQRLHQLLKGAAPIRPNMAVRLAALVGNDPRFWLNLQNAYDVWEAERDNADDIARIRKSRRKISVIEGTRSPLSDTSLLESYQNTTMA